MHQSVDSRADRLGIASVYKLRTCTNARNLVPQDLFESGRGLTWLTQDGGSSLQHLYTYVVHVGTL